MRFAYPRFPAEFEIPDEWWVAAGMDGFNRLSECFRSTDGAVLVSLTDVEPPSRLQECRLDFRGFDKERLVSILRGIATGAEIAPVPLRELPRDEFFRIPYDYQLLDGYHRFHASVAVGFKFLPALVRRS
jgi:hypothetical protein